MKRRAGNPSRPARSRSSESRSAATPCSTPSGRPWARESAMKREQRHGLWQQPPYALLGGLGLALLTVVCYRLENLSLDGVPISFADGHIRNLPAATLYFTLP